ncbi:hypothetical protein GCM10022405_47540 [Gibbsiella dentisursi]|uniref:Uncharacterized protein n=1 Tax=Gibbsiella dentisursi TaxID=796890 RepID=A0ABP7M7N7_9GAMM
MVFIEGGDRAGPTIRAIHTHQHQWALLIVILAPQAHDALIGNIAAGGKRRRRGMETAASQTAGDRRR